MGKPLCYDAGKIEVSKSFINKIYSGFSDSIHFAAPVSSLSTIEIDVVRGVLETLQGFSSSLFYWDDDGKRFRAKTGIYVTHLSQTSLHAVVNQFMYAATCLQLVGILVTKIEKWVRSPPPTLRAFACSASAWLRRLRDIALKEQTKMSNAGTGTTPTLLGLTNSLSSLCSGAEYLLQTVHGAIPLVYFESNSSVPAADVAVHILDFLYKKLDEVCLVQGGEEEEYQMILHMFIGSLLPYIEGLDSWLFEGTLDDPFEEMFFYANKATSIDEADFWEKSYLFRRTQCLELDSELSSPLDKKEVGQRESIAMARAKGKEQSNGPLFIKDIAKAIVSAGKSLQLIRHIPMISSGINGRGNDFKIDEGYGNSKDGFHHGQSIAGLTLSEVFCVSVAGLIGHGDRIFRYLCQDDWCKTKIHQSLGFCLRKEKVGSNEIERLPMTCFEKIWYKFLVDTLLEKGLIYVTSGFKDGNNLAETSEVKMTAADANRLPLLRSFCPENPVITVCQGNLSKNRNSWKVLNLSKNFYLPPLNDEALRKAIFGKDCRTFPAVEGTNYTFGFGFGESEHLRSQDDSKMLEVIFPFPTVLPSIQDDCRLSELLPFQKKSTLPSRVLSWIQNFEPKNNILPVVIMQECLTVYIKKQVDCIGKDILSKLMDDWRLMDELAVLRAIYLLGSGDLLQHFLTVIFNKLDKGETWDDDFELNTILQESIRNSADSVLLSAPDSLIVSLAKSQGSNSTEQSYTDTIPTTPHGSRAQIFGISDLDLLKFTYKVSWPLELIANTEAIKKYNQVMGFLLKVKRAKFLLDKARRWMWKGRGTATNYCKHHWLVEQKLLHFVDAFHQYVMDRVYHSAWQDLCESMAAARSLDEVIEVHESYLLSIQRQCFVVPDKLWALIASRINSILGLALDFYTVQQTLSGGAVSAIKAKCEMEIDRIEKQFDDCIAFLLRVLSFKLNVGNFPHLADLVTRINYNYFYMSDSGNLMTVPNLENAASRARKAFVSRTD
ncbi:gamma-tubulin complex component 5 isoform X2 [Morus notabilis]|uniref:gamma-tubulin complex component 5 isoform X2 n=1 Tax=Morus notabilis TaxID=981085 RepID=UPI000CED0A9D|nr:gamma-tubulin complex component 5 isoform X2 [Morus notabilis]